MKNAFLMGAVLLLGAALTFAQETNSSTSNSGQTGASASSQTGTTGSSAQTGNTGSSSQTGMAGEQSTTGTGNTVQGCLSGSGGNWMLTSSSGVSYQLKGGDESQFSQNVNKEVEVMGTPGATASASTTAPSTGATAGNSSNTSDNTAGSTNGSAGTSGTATAHASASSSKTLEVTSVRKISDTCSTSNTSAPQH